jgi:hypothetical protein
MCTPSPPADDWVEKGFHVRIDGIELVARPNHLGGITFQSFFSSDADARVTAAIRTAEGKCLADPRVRGQWIKRIEAAKTHLAGQNGELRILALGRLAELHFLEIALRRYGV